MKAGSLAKLLCYPPNNWRGNKTIGPKLALFLASGNKHPVNLNYILYVYTFRFHSHRVIQGLQLVKIHLNSKTPILVQRSNTKTMLYKFK